MIVVYEDSIGKETEFFPESYVKLEDVLKIIKKERMLADMVKKHSFETRVVYECTGKINVLNTIAQQIIDLKISEDTLRKELNNDFRNS